MKKSQLKTQVLYEKYKSEGDKIQTNTSVYGIILIVLGFCWVWLMMEIRANEMSVYGGILILFGLIFIVIGNVQNSRRQKILKNYDEYQQQQKAKRNNLR